MERHLLLLLYSNGAIQITFLYPELSFISSLHSRAEDEDFRKRAEKGVQRGTTERVRELRWGGPWWWGFNTDAYRNKMKVKQMKKLVSLTRNEKQSTVCPSLHPGGLKIHTVTVHVETSLWMMDRLYICKHIIVSGLTIALWKALNLLECESAREGSLKTHWGKPEFLVWTLSENLGTPGRCGPQQSAWDSTPNQSVNLWSTPSRQSFLRLSVWRDIFEVIVSNLRISDHKDVTGVLEVGYTVF